MGVCGNPEVSFCDVFFFLRLLSFGGASLLYSFPSFWPNEAFTFTFTCSIPRKRAVTFMDPVNNNVLLMGGDDADAMKTGVAIRGNLPLLYCQQI